ncbi:hypothetical protein, unknown function [Leishmania mexicana MHOM/GT/2001/U1103]|uniref:Uncharacterized protein n=1 Tax=Leishmania mexicana (strain MHOM/GT/2001/U1103) TaxID=929439 RepID=E9AWP9_LEIMU|nr:hypothetical protein, unknown function [Leishmania mexicana MHOM/GT/2001/U1103]CBZ27385.1 hypothetical protein, unknown function [Leishmania mexicana MHOM/GT/2001/U1103]
MPANAAQAHEKLVPGQLLQLADNGTPTIVTPLCNEGSLNASIHTYKDKGYLPYFTRAVKAAQQALVNELRAAGVEVPNGAEASHLEGVCGVHCRDEANCSHVLDSEHITGTLYDEGTNDTRMIVACDPIQTKLRDDCVECFPRVNKVSGWEELVVRVHLFYLNTTPCMSVQDRRARLVTQKHFVPKNTRTFQGYHVFNYAKRGSSARTPHFESMFPYTPKNTKCKGFTLGRKCTAITVESVFVRDPARQQRPFYAEDAEQARVYFSHLCVDAFVTDDELVEHFPLESMDAAAMPAFTHDRDAEKYHVLVRLYLLAHDQNWTATQPHGCPHPLGGCVSLPVLFRSCATEVIVPDACSRKSQILLQQRLLPDVEMQVTRFCFRRVVSEVLRQRVVAAAADTPERYIPVVCYMPHGDRVPVFTDKQVSVLARLYPHLGIRRPTSRREWAHLSRTLYQHGISLFDTLAAVGVPLRDAHGAVIDTDAYVPYTPDMADDYFLVIANRPLRDYICVTNQRWLCEQLLLPDHHPPVGACAFAAWVRYWNAMVHLKHELEKQVNLDTVSAHLGLRLPAGETGQRAACLVNGVVTDTKGGLIFPDLGGCRFRDKEHVGALLPGAPVLYICRAGRKLNFTYVQTPMRFVRGLPLKQANEQRPAQDVIAAANAPANRGGGTYGGGQGEDGRRTSVAIHA